MSKFKVDEDLLRAHVQESFARQVEQIVLNESDDIDAEDDEGEESDEDDDGEEDTDEDEEESERLEESISELEVVATEKGGRQVNLGTVANLKQLQKLASGGKYGSFEATDSAGKTHTFTVSNGKIVRV